MYLQFLLYSSVKTVSKKNAQNQINQFLKENFGGLRSVSDLFTLPVHSNKQLNEGIPGLVGFQSILLKGLDAFMLFT